MNLLLHHGELILSLDLITKCSWVPILNELLLTHLTRPRSNSAGPTNTGVDLTTSQSCQKHFLLLLLIPPA